ncbi:fungal hydrophobin [Lentinus tigrinus ALCF2SS1-7]|uniref:Hydrophobin n=1 Tax=Lentinus tigrinus ALCF2SS1-6 TaxID=1328759 RepID=A0A5C2SQW6_9APHY|nr:fungal hydrophobin [Lentinus tigrinus ALCF2SS1-6]RPD79073.1 fungal hydrophobin [Lentinus tigrinus ALCF2SS1-7]
MFVARTSLSILSLAILAVAIPWDGPTTTVTVTTTSSPPGSTQPAGSCSTGPVQCCDSASDPATSLLLGLLGIVLQGDGEVGLDCSPITVIGAGTGNACSAHAVCCQNNNVGGLISIGCVPVIL